MLESPCSFAERFSCRPDVSSCSIILLVPRHLNSRYRKFTSLADKIRGNRNFFRKLEYREPAIRCGSVDLGMTVPWVRHFSSYTYANRGYLVCSCSHASREKLACVVAMTRPFSIIRSSKARCRSLLPPLPKDGQPQMTPAHYYNNPYFKRTCRCKIVTSSPETCARPCRSKGGSERAGIACIRRPLHVVSLQHFLSPLYSCACVPFSAPAVVEGNPSGWFEILLTATGAFVLSPSGCCSAPAGEQTNRNGTKAHAIEGRQARAMTVRDKHSPSTASETKRKQRGDLQKPIKTMYTHTRVHAHLQKRMTRAYKNGTTRSRRK